MRGARAETETEDWEKRQPSVTVSTGAQYTRAMSEVELKSELNLPRPGITVEAAKP